MQATQLSELLASLKSIVGSRHVITGERRTRRFATGYRCGSGPVLAVVRPGTPIEQYQAFVACIDAGAIVILQAANTGLTGGSTPDGTYDRPVVIISTLRIKGIHLIDEGRQVVCMAGATLFDLERLLEPLDREPHSVIGSSCIGASVIGGICNNSGGALVRRGPAYTELAAYARVTRSGRVELVNHLGIDLGDDPELVLERLAVGDFPASSIRADSGAASASNYEGQVRNISANTPARFNADPSRLFETSGSAGKVMVIAVRLDTFPKDNNTATFYVGSNDTNELTTLRRRLLAECRTLPVSGEYIHRDAFDIAAVYGKDVFVAIERLGTDRLPGLFALRSRVESLSRRLPFLPSNLADLLLQGVSRLLPQHLPKRMREWRHRFEHHLILKVADDGIDETRTLLDELFPSAKGADFECTAIEAQKAFLQRFAVAGAAIRYCAIHAKTAGPLIALDIALCRNDTNWREHLPDDVAESIGKALYYGHFLCHVFHQDYVLKPGVDPVKFEDRLFAMLDARGAQYPAEHNVGHLYAADEALVEHYRSLDPGNHLNPGIGKTSRNPNWA